MKKSKIIVPALGLLLLSTAASVSGTVAWFTANRTYNTTISSFGVGSADGALAGTSITPIVGCMASEGTVTFKTHPASADVVSVLADGSFDEASKTLYIDDGSVTTDQGVNTSKFISVGTTADTTAWLAGTKDSKNYYYAIAWTVRLTYTFGAQTNDVDLFVDLSNVATATKFAVSQQSGEGTHQVEKGLRIALLQGTNSVILAPFHTAAEHSSNSYGRAKGPTTFTAYSSEHINFGQSDTYGNANYGKFNLAKAADQEANPNTRTDYLGYFDNDGSATKYLDVTVVVWLEGTDPATVSASNLADTLSGNINFYCTNHNGTY